METFFKAMDLAMWEMGEVLREFPAEDLWRRPHPRLLSVGEIATHVTHAQVTYFLPESFETPLRHPAAWYYFITLEQPVTLDLGPEELYAEMTRVYEACKVALRATPPDLEAPHPNRDEMKWADVLDYQVFHIAYHAGQILSARHLMGHEPPDN